MRTVSNSINLEEKICNVILIVILMNFVVNKYRNLIKNLNQIKLNYNLITYLEIYTFQLPSIRLYNLPFNLIICIIKYFKNTTL